MSLPAPAAPANITSTQVYLDHVLTSKMMDQTSQLLNSGNLFTIAGMLKFLILMSLDEIKVMAKEYVKFLKNWVVANYKTVFYYCPNIKHMCNAIYEFYLLYIKPVKKQEESNNQIEPEIPEYKAEVVVNPVPHFWNVLYKYSKENPSACKFVDYNTDTVSIINMREFNFNKTIGNFEIDFRGNNIFIEKQLEYTFIMKNGVEEPIDNKVLENRLVDPTKVKCVCDCVPYKYKKIMRYVHEKAEGMLKTMPYFKVKESDTDKKNYPYIFHSDDLQQISFYGDTPTNIDSSYGNLGAIIHSQYKNVNYSLFAIELFMIGFLETKAEPAAVITTSAAVFNCIFTLEPNAMFYKRTKDSYSASKNKGRFDMCVLQLDKEFGRSHIEQFSKDFIKININPSEKAKKIEKTKCIIKSPTEKTKEYLNNEFQQFISFILSNPISKSLDNIHTFSIYRLLVNRKTTTEIIDNPEYIRYMEEQKETEEKEQSSETKQKEEAKLEKELENLSLEQSKKESTNGEKDNMQGRGINRTKRGRGRSPSPYQFNMFDYQMCMMPPKKITKYIHTNEIVTTLVSEKYKSFDTLYLRESTIKKLNKVVDDFKNKQALMKELGIPNKLNILFYGNPGTGKTTSSWAIASFLEKNLYYVKLNEATTCNQLMMIIQHVVKNCVNGGIILLEEIDVMSKVCHRRENNIKIKSMTESMSSSEGDEPLTLEFLLNVLQGQLTPDGLVIIATTTSLETLDPALYRKGRFDLVEELKLCDHYQVAKIFKKLIGRDIREDVLNKIAINKYSPVEIITSCSYHVKGDADDLEILEEYINKI